MKISLFRFGGVGGWVGANAENLQCKQVQILDLAQYRDVKNFIEECLTCFNGSDGYYVRCGSIVWIGLYVWHYGCT